MSVPLPQDDSAEHLRVHAAALAPAAELERRQQGFPCVRDRWTWRDAFDMRHEFRLVETRLGVFCLEERREDALGKETWVPAEDSGWPSAVWPRLAELAAKAAAV